MHILHVYKDYPPVRGGIENHVRILAEGQAAQGHTVEVVVASPGARIWGFFLDTIFQHLILLACMIPVLLLALLSGGVGLGLVFSFLLFAGFLVRNFYFTWFEIRWQGSTPGT